MSRGRRINTKVVIDILTGEILERVGFQHFGPIERAMGVRLASVFSNTFIGPLPANASETLIFTTGGIGEAVDNAAVLLFWFCNITAGTSTTALVYHIRRGATAVGTSVGVAGGWSFTTVAGNITSLSGVYQDSPGIVAGQQYTLTISQTAATGAGVFNDGALIAMVL